MRPIDFMTADLLAPDRVCGISVRTSTALVKQFRFPRTKNRRIRKKWAKRPENFRPSDQVLMMGATAVVHPAMLPTLRRMLEGGK